MQQALILLFLMGQCCLVTCHLYEYHYIKHKKTWSEAQRYCRENYTDVATVSNMPDMKRLYQLVKDEEEAWIGLYKNTDSNRTWHWSLPGVEFNYSETNWKGGEPNDKGENGKLENCVIIYEHPGLSDLVCEKNRHFLCYNESKTSKKFHLIGEKKTWWEAQRYCREKHTDLVSGQDQLEDQELKTLVGNKEQIFIGLFRDTWAWSDGSSFSFRHFTGTDEMMCTPQQGSSERDEQCAVTLKDSERWKSCNCTEQKPFICYDDKVILIQKKMNWEDALYYCREHHYDLVSITNLDEQRWIQEKAKNATTPYVWTGLRYTCTLDFWFWVSNEAVSYKNWASDQGGNEDGNDCDMSGAMEKGGRHKWFKKIDNEEFNFICSVP